MSVPDDELIELLSRVEFFAGLDVACLASLERALVRLRVPAGTALITQGEAGDGLFVVLHGRFAVDFTGEDQVPRRVGEIGAGEIVGEMALLSDEPRATTVRALRDSEAFKLTPAVFEQLTFEHPALFRRLATLLAGRLRVANRAERRIAPRRAVALLPHSAGTPLLEFGRALATALAVYANPLLVTKAEVAHLGPEADGDCTNLLVWLAERERQGCCLLLVAEPGEDIWNQLCASHADVILLVAAATAPPPPAEMERMLRPELMASRELVLLHAPDATPEGTRHWLGEGRFHRHHHVRLADPEHMGRLARWLSGNAVGLVLGGGGARGFAHIGVVRALMEARVPIDMVAGTSMGSIMAAEVALGWDWQSMLERSDRAFSCEPLKRDNTLPLLSLVTSKKVVRMFRDLFGEQRIEDCWLPYFCVAANLTHARAMIPRAGLIWQRVRASSALPGVGPPVIERGEYLVDGAVLDNLPAEQMQADGAGYVIAVNVSPREDLRTDWPDTYELSGWRALWARLGFGRRPPLPSMLWVIQRTVLLGSVANADRVRDRVSLYLSPPVEEFDMFHWSRIREVVAAGYHYSSPLIQRWASDFEESSQRSILPVPATSTLRLGEE